MKKFDGVLRWVQLVILGTVLLNERPLASAAERNLTQTNWTERWITNLIEVRMPKNIFVDEFHTNWTRQLVTNVVQVFATNWSTQRITNTVPVQATRTVDVTAYKTNWNKLTRTNFIEISQTNWETVLVMKTNWITQPVTNVVRIDLITNRLPETEIASKPVLVTQEAPSQSLAATTATLSDSLSFEASRTARPPNRNVVELMVKLHWPGEGETQLQVRQWRVESENGAILCYSQEQDFRRELPTGRYRIEVRAQKNANSPLVAAKGLIDLSAANAVMLPLTSAIR